MPHHNSVFGVVHFALNIMASTKAQLEAQVAELQQQLSDAQAASQPAELSKIDKRKQCASNTTVVMVRRCFPITDQEGEAVPGGFRFPAVQSMDVNFGTKDEPEYRKIDVQETWFEVWNNGTPLGDQLNTLINSTEYALLRVYWEFSTPAKNVFVTDEVNERTGRSYKKHNFKYTPKKRVFAFDTLSSKDLESAVSEDQVLF